MRSILKFHFLFILLICSANSILAQDGQYSFNACTFVDDAGNYPDATTIFDPSCDCGLVDEGLYFDGNDDHLIFPSEIDSLMEEDFTLSFYFRFDQVTTRTDLFSVQSECTLDSFLSISYIPTSNILLFELAQNIGNIQSEEVSLDLSVCWHRLVLTKSGLFYNLYIDDKLAITILSNGIVSFDKTARASLTNSPCLAVNIDRFNGWIDEFTFQERALSAIELLSNSLRPDQIITNDTTIIAGSPVDIEVGATCATNFTWSPTSDLDDITILNPTASPNMTTTYTITIENTGNCSTQDEMVINVIDPNALNCEEILIPNAFTPNNDQLNDTYGISSLFLVDALEYFEIYDRWGGKMWTTTNKNETWDGTFGGDLVNPGMYIYKIKYTCSGDEYVKVDNFSVLR